MKIENGKKYETKAGDKVEIMQKNEKGHYLGKWFETIAGHKSNQNRHSFWNENGEWILQPKGIHDIKKEISA